MTKQNSFLLYWQERSVMEHASNDVPLDVVASNQLSGVFPGDTIWVVSLSEERELALTGRLVVGEIVEYEEAMQRMPDAGLWQAEYYAFPEDGTESFIRWVALNELAEELRFEDPDSDRFVFRDGKLNPQQLRSLRRLTRESAAILVDLWEGMEEMDPDEILDPAEALEHYRAQVAENPNDATAHYDLGVALGANDLPEDAVRAYRRSIELSPDYPAYYNLGSELLALDRIEKAIEAYNAAIFIAYEFSPAHFMLGVAYSNAERYEEAIQATQAGLKIDPDDPNAHFNIGRSYSRLGEFQKACEAFDNAIAVAPDFARAFYFKGICFRHLGEVNLEIDFYKKALDLVPDFFDAMFALGAAWAIKQSGSAEGIEFIEPDDTLELQDATHQFYLGLSFLALGINDLMIDHIKHLRKLDQSLADRLEAFLYNEGLRTSTTVNAANRTEFDDPYDLSRFTVAQDRVYEQVLAELRCGEKATHWMWFIFPQIDGLGHSPTTRYFSIKSVEEARQYVEHPVLGPRLIQCTEGVLAIEGRSISKIFRPPDDLKLRSSMTLFAHIAGSSVFDRVIDKYLHGERDAKTLNLLGRQKTNVC